MEGSVGKIVQILIALFSIGSLTIFFIVNTRLGEQDFANRPKLLLKSVMGAVAFGLACVSMSLVGGIISIEMSFILGLIGALVGLLSFVSRWINYELHFKRLNPYISRKARDVVDDRRRKMNKEAGQVKDMPIAKEPFKLKKSHKLILTVILNAFFGAICLAFATAISGGGVEGLLLGLSIGAILGLVVWAGSSMLGLYSQFYEK